MTTTIITKNSSTASAVPLAADLVQGELAVNVTDKRVYTKNASAAVVELGATPSSVTTGAVSCTTLATSGNVTLGDASTDTLNVGNGGIVKDASGNVGIGTSSPASGVKLDVNGTVKIGTGTSSSAGCIFSNPNYGMLFQAFQASPAQADFSWLNSAGTERARIDSSGNVLVTNPAGLGYGTGSGGTVTQATSKSTSVTLNKPTGQITMNNAALAGNTAVEFTFNNSLLASSDNIVFTLQGGSAVSAGYVFGTRTIGAGFCTVAVRNITAGSLSEALVINFAIIKGATA